MAKMIDYDATIKKFFKTVLSWLEDRPYRLRNGVDEEKITYNYMKMMASDPRKYTTKQAVYSNFDKLEGLVEYDCNDKGACTVNSEFFWAVVNVLDAIGEYYVCDCQYTEEKLIASIKGFNIALNRKHVLKAMYYMLKKPYYFAQKQK